MSAKRISITILTVILFAISPLVAQAGDDWNESGVPFKVGEELHFSINWSLANIGTASLMVTDLVDADGHWCYELTGVGNSNKTIDLFYPVRDRFYSYMDTTELFTRRFFKDQKEGKHERKKRIFYDQENHTAFDSVNKETKEIIPYAQDDLSVFYYFRTLDMEVGRGMLIEGFNDKDGNPLKVSVLRKEWVDVPAGRFYCTVVEPRINSGGLFQHKGNLNIWITDDEHKIPVQVKSELDFGEILILLENYKLGDGEPIKDEQPL